MSEATGGSGSRRPTPSTSPPCGDAVRQLGDDGRRVLRVVGSAGRVADVVAVIPDLAAAGVTDVVVDVDWSGDVDEQASRLLAALRT